MSCRKHTLAILVQGVKGSTALCSAPDTYPTNLRIDMICSTMRSAHTACKSMEWGIVYGPLLKFSGKHLVGDDASALLRQAVSVVVIVQVLPRRHPVLAVQELPHLRGRCPIRCTSLVLHKHTTAHTLKAGLCKVAA